MKAEKISALATSTIAFVTIIGLMVGFYYNLKSSNINIFYIIIFELLFVLAIGLFISWRGVK
ncbi:hypothetical protein HYV88_02095 [Candidatus Woesearchaeota archaeon]|nr:hypothetical protein [Candidatus Woesearchaeota archaeon]